MTTVARRNAKRETADAQITCVVADDHPAVLDSVSRVLDRKSVV